MEPNPKDELSSDLILGLEKPFIIVPMRPSVRLRHRLTSGRGGSGRGTARVTRWNGARWSRGGGSAGDALAVCAGGPGPLAEKDLGNSEEG